jgi:hypothetical protein
MMDRSFWGSPPGADADAAMGVGEDCGASFWKVLEGSGGFREKREWSGRLALLGNWSLGQGGQVKSVSGLLAF